LQKPYRAAQSQSADDEKGAAQIATAGKMIKNT